MFEVLEKLLDNLGNFFDKRLCSNSITIDQVVQE